MSKDRSEAGYTSGQVTGTGLGIPPAPKDKGDLFWEVRGWRWQARLNR